MRRDCDRMIEVGQCLLPTSERPQRVGTVVERICEMRIERQRLRKGCHRLLVAPEQSQHIAPIEMGLGEAGIQRSRPFKACERVLMTAEAGQCGPAVAPVLSDGRLDHECLVVACDRIAGTPKLTEHIAPAAIGISLPWLTRNRPVEARQRVLQPSKSRQRHAA
jgi:hypothetical protein